MTAEFQTGRHTMSAAKSLPAKTETEAQAPPDGETSKRLDRLFDKFEEMEFAHAEIIEKSQDLLELLQDIARRTGVTDSLVSTLKSLAETTASAGSPGLDRIEQRLGEIEGKLATPSGPSAEMPDLAEVLEGFESLAERLDKQDEKLARLQSTLSDAGHQEMSDRLEQKIDSLKRMLDDPTSVTRPIVDAVRAAQSGPEDLRDMIRVEVAAAVSQEMTSLAARLDHLSTESAGPALAQIADEMSTLSATINDLKTRPDPILDMGPQRRSLSLFSKVLGEKIARLEAISDRFATTLDQSDATPDIDSQRAMIEEAFAPLSRQMTADAEALGAIEMRISDIAERLNVLESETARGGDPVPMIAMQKKSLSRFMGAAGTFLRRLDHFTDEMRGAIAKLEARIDAMPQDQADPPQIPDRDLVGALAAVVDTNQALVRDLVSSDRRILQAHEDFLSELRRAVAEHIATSMRSAALPKK